MHTMVSGRKMDQQVVYYFERWLNRLGVELILLKVCQAKCKLGSLGSRELGLGWPGAREERARSFSG